MKKLFLILIIVSKFCYSQQLQNGLIMPVSQDNLEICCIYSPKEGFNIYDQPNGKMIALLAMRHDPKDDQSLYKIYLTDNRNKKLEVLNYSYFEVVGYDNFSIDYHQRKNGFLKILSSKTSYWISENEINAKNFKILEWQYFLATQDVFYENVGGLNIRESPSANSKLIKTLKGDLFEINPTSQINGLWMKVKVTKRKQQPCVTNLNEKENIEYKLEGWIKILDDTGLPNVSVPFKGC